MYSSIVRRAVRICRSLNPLQTNGAIVLYYHGVERRIFDPTVQALHMPLDEFVLQIEFLRKAYTIISMEEFAQKLRTNQLNSSHLLLTFDDGFRNNLTVVAPILKSFGIPFTVFVSTDHIETGRRFPGYQMRASIWCTEKTTLTLPSVGVQLEIRTPAQRLAAIDLVGEKMRNLPEAPTKVLLQELQSHIPDSRWPELDAMLSASKVMTWDDVRTLHDQGVTIGSHTHSHCILHSHQEAEEIERQVATSKQLITDHIGECRYFSFPHGTMRDISKTAFESVRSSYELAFSTVSSPVNGQANPHLIPRVGTPADLERLRETIEAVRVSGRKYRKWARKMEQDSDGTPRAMIHKQLI